MKILFTLLFFWQVNAVSGQELPTSNRFDTVENKSWKIYPVPVGPVLNLQYEGRAPVQGVISIVVRCITTGIVFTRLRVASTTRFLAIPVQNLGRGIYDIRVWVGQHPAFSRKFLK